jgi:hypothetical protein
VSKGLVGLLAGEELEVVAALAGEAEMKDVTQVVVEQLMNLKTGEEQKRSAAERRVLVSVPGIQ